MFTGVYKLPSFSNLFCRLQLIPAVALAFVYRLPPGLLCHASPLCFSFFHTYRQGKTVKMSKSPDKVQRKVHYPFWFGGSAASMAAVVTHPLDLGKDSPLHCNGVANV